MKSEFSTNDYGLFFNDAKLLFCAANTGVLLPIQALCSALECELTEDNYFYLGEFAQKRTYAVHIDEEYAQKSIDYHFRPAREALLLTDMALCQHIHRAKQLLSWHRSTLFCGRCGTKTKLSHIERCKICDHCKNTIYPFTSPAVIVLIYHENKILLGRSPHFPPNVYSNLAGFIEVGENCEAAVHREIAEEVGISVTNLQYVGSQSWPFPNSFMIGFYAQYNSGVIEINFNELEDAQWFEIDNLPLLPAQFSIARTMIDNYVTTFKQNTL